MQKWVAFHTCSAKPVGFGISYAEEYNVKHA